MSREIRVIDPALLSDSRDVALRDLHLVETQIADATKRVLRDCASRGVTPAGDVRVRVIVQASVRGFERPSDVPFAQISRDDWMALVVANGDRRPLAIAWHEAEAAEPVSPAAD